MTNRLSTASSSERASKKAPGRQPAKSTYHHGELAERLLELAIEAIEVKGTEALSLRALAREAGVSATAPYRHFPSKRCLLAAIATRGFQQLTAKMAEQLEEIESIEDRFIGLGLAYVKFAVENPVSYEMMFGSVIADFSDYQMLQEAAESSYAQLLSELDSLIQARRLNIAAIELGAVVWSGVHGMASLMISKQGKVERTKALSTPGRSISGLHQDTERAMRIMFGHLIGDSTGTV